MPLPKQIQKVFTWLLINQVSNGTDEVGQVHDGDFCLKIWGTFNGCTVTIEILAEDEIDWIPCYQMTQPGVQFGRVGSGNERFRAVVTDAGASTNVSYRDPVMPKRKDIDMTAHSARASQGVDGPEDYIHPVTGEHIVAKYEAFCVTYTNKFVPKLAMEAAGYPVEERRHTTMMRAFRMVMARKDVQLRIRGLIREKAEHSGIGPDWVVMKWMELLDRCMQADPVLDGNGDPTGEWKFDSRGASKILEDMAKYFGMFHKEQSQGRKISIHVDYGKAPEIKDVKDPALPGASERVN